MNQIYLDLSWSTSRGRDTYGYNICRLDDTSIHPMKRYKTMGGGYDMVGTVFGHWLEDRFQDRLLALKAQAHAVWDGKKYQTKDGQHAYWGDMTGDFYGMTHNTPDNIVTLDGACGLDSMRTIAKAVDLEVSMTHNRKGNMTGFIVTDNRKQAVVAA